MVSRNEVSRPIVNLYRFAIDVDDLVGRLDVRGVSEREHADSGGGDRRASVASGVDANSETLCAHQCKEGGRQERNEWHPGRHDGRTRETERKYKTKGRCRTLKQKERGGMKKRLRGLPTLRI